MATTERDGDYNTPGQFIQALLEERGWTQRVLAIVLKIDETGLNKIVAGKRSVDAELALALGDVFGVHAERFLDIQKRYDLAKARIIARPDPTRATRAALFGDLPITEMIKRGWLGASDIRDLSEVEKSLKTFFAVGSLDEIEILPHAAKKTNVSTNVTPAQMAWIYRAKAIASEMIVGRFSPSSSKHVLEQLEPLRSAAEEARKVPRILTDYGIRFVLVESLPSAKIDGVCFWLNDSSPVIGLSMRFDRIDNFWFVLRHELEHVFRRHGLSAAILDVELEGDRAGIGTGVTDEERIANEAAAEFCVPKKKMDSFISRKAPFFAERDVLGFARTLGVHPGLVAGQIRHRTRRYDKFTAHLAKIRCHVAPSAIVDGWGDIVPMGNEGGENVY